VANILALWVREGLKMGAIWNDKYSDWGWLLLALLLCELECHSQRRWIEYKFEQLMPVKVFLHAAQMLENW
jgi:hypothetical protein